MTIFIWSIDKLLVHWNSPKLTDCFWYMNLNNNSTVIHSASSKFFDYFHLILHNYQILKKKYKNLWTSNNHYISADQIYLSLTESSQYTDHL